MSHYYASFGHDFTDGPYCEGCAPADNHMQCSYCVPQLIPYTFYWSKAEDIPAGTMDMSECVSVNESDEAIDYPAHCTTCGEFLANSLTAEGEEYTMSQIDTHLRFVEAYGTESSGNHSVILEWIDAYGLPEGWEEDTIKVEGDDLGRTFTLTDDSES